MTESTRWSYGCVRIMDFLYVHDLELKGHDVIGVSRNPTVFMLDEGPEALAAEMKKAADAILDNPILIYDEIKDLLKP